MKPSQGFGITYSYLSSDRIAFLDLEFENPEISSSRRHQPVQIEWHQSSEIFVRNFKGRALNSWDAVELLLQYELRALSSPRFRGLIPS